jgi:hypothetical protein
MHLQVKEQPAGSGNHCHQQRNQPASVNNTAPQDNKAQQPASQDNTNTSKGRAASWLSCKCFSIDPTIDPSADPSADEKLVGSIVQRVPTRQRDQVVAG